MIHVGLTQTPGMFHSPVNKYVDLGFSLFGEIKHRLQLDFFGECVQSCVSIGLHGFRFPAETAGKSLERGGGHTTAAAVAAEVSRQQVQL